jgi:HAE1 family hydrophobic/amphiphilic exporter-1
MLMVMVFGIISFSKLNTELMPDTTFGTVTVTTNYQGATPEEIERLISKPLEEQISTISGLKSVSSRNLEGISIVTAEFNMEEDIDKALQAVRDKVSQTRNSLPSTLEEEPVVVKFDPADSPIIKLAVISDLDAVELYDFVHEKVKPMIEKISGVGKAEMTGGTKREIQVEIDRKKLYDYNFSAINVAGSLMNAGSNVSVGRYDAGEKSVVFRTIGEFTDIDQIKRTTISFSGDVANSTVLKSLGEVKEGAKDADTISYFYYPEDYVQKPVKAQTAAGNNQNAQQSGRQTQAKKEAADSGASKYLLKSCIIMNIYRQSGANSVSVANQVKKEMTNINMKFAGTKGSPAVLYVYDATNDITANVKDVQETLLLGILLAVIVVYFFLGNVRATLIASVSIPVSLIGAFILMYVLGFSMNIMTLMALSLCIGILVDDAIVVQENIFRRMENGEKPIKAAVSGTKEVMLAVTATTLTIVSVFTPIGMVTGMTGRLFKPFALTVASAVIISLCVALTISPLLNGYFMKSDKKDKNIVIKWFELFQEWLESIYKKIVAFSLEKPAIIITATVIFFIASLFAFGRLKMTMFNPSDSDNMSVSITLPAATSLEGTKDITMRMFDEIKTIPEVQYMDVQVGNSNGENNLSSIDVFLHKKKAGGRATVKVKDDIRKIMAKYPETNAMLADYDSMGSGRSFTFDIYGDDMEQLKAYSDKIAGKMRNISDLTDVDTSYKEGKPEYQIVLDENKMKLFGVSALTAGTELRYHVTGALVGKLHDNGLEYDIRMRLKREQRDIQKTFNEMKVPNMNGRMVPLSKIATFKNVKGPSEIKRYNRARYIQLSAGIAPKGAVGSAMQKLMKVISEDPAPQGITCGITGEGERMNDMVTSITTAIIISIIAVFLVLASLYDSFVTPFTILLALPTAASGVFFTFLIFGKNIDMNTLIGIITLMGIATKNSILLVDFAIAGIKSGMSRKEAIMNACSLRFRPIIMTTMAIFLGTLPMALGGEASRFRGGMGLAICGGILVSTVMTLVVVPAVFEFMDKLREKTEGKIRERAENA